MPKGPSGRIVVEIDRVLKEELYDALKAEGFTLKEWFLENVESFLKDRSQLSLSLDALITKEGRLGP